MGYMTAKKLIAQSKAARESLKMKTPELRTVALSEYQALIDQGYRPFHGGDASKANSDHFQILVKDGDKCRDVVILCPTFLRGPLGINDSGRSISY